MFDVLVRMIDTQGKEVLPSEFMAAAERNDLMKNIDRWVVGASLSFAAQKQAAVPVRAPVARERARQRLRRVARQPPALEPAEPQRLCFQMTEESASSYVPQVKALASSAARAALPLRARELRLRARQLRHARSRCRSTS